MASLGREEAFFAGSLEKYRQQLTQYFFLSIKDADLVGGKVWDDALRRLLSGVVHTNKSSACVLYICKLLWV